MSEIQDNLAQILDTLPKEVTLVAVSKTKPIEDIMEAYKAGHRDFGENKIQEMAQKQEAMPKDINWHMIGHVQRNKVKYMAPFVHLIHGVDSLKLLREIDKQAKKYQRTISCLLQVHIAREETKFGMDEEELLSLLNSPELRNMENISIEGLMGMATFTPDKALIQQEFSYLSNLFDRLQKQQSEWTNVNMTTLSMGMSGDYSIAVECGSSMVRIGSHIFGSRN